MYQINGYVLPDRHDLGAIHDNDGKLLTFKTLKDAEAKAAEMNRAYGDKGLCYAPAAVGDDPVTVRL